jgi:hypothetical protein
MSKIMLVRASCRVEIVHHVAYGMQRTGCRIIQFLEE